MPNTQQTFNFKDGQEGFQISGHDIINHYYKPEFFTPCLENYTDNTFTPPIKTSDIIKKVAEEGFYILAGNGYDKTGLARHIAWKISKQNGKPLPVQQWASSANPQNLELYIQKEETQTVFILPDISNRHVDHDFSALYRTVKSKNHYVIITTRYPLVTLKIDRVLEQCSWEPDPSETLYSPQVLARLLTNRLNKVSKKLPAELKEREFHSDGEMIGNLKLQELAEKLKTPESIDRFISLLSSIESNLNETVILDVASKCNNDKHALGQWFFNFLKPHEHLIAIGLCLFDGLYDDQFFAAMEELVEYSWHKRENRLRGLDYRDMEPLSNYYSLFSLNGDGLKKVENHLDGIRETLLNVAWNSYRRQILAALPVLVKLVKQSVADGLKNRELYGSTEKEVLLRDVISESLCHIGMISVEAVEDTLLRLAADNHHEVQAVVAQAMARWRQYEKDSKLFDLLERWREEATAKHYIESFLNDTHPDLTITPQVFIKSTIALTVGFAAFHDSPNKLNDKLLALFQELSKDISNPFIYFRFAIYTLPMVIRFHARQLDNMLKIMVKDTRLSLPVGAGLAIVYDEGAEEVKDILDKWFYDNISKLSKKRPKKKFNMKHVPHADAIMATVAYAYGGMKYENDNFSLDEGFRRLGDILQEARCPFLRQAVFVAVIRQIIFHFEKAGKNITLLFHRMDDIEIKYIVNELVKIHLVQRSQLEGGDEFLDWKDNKFPIWIDKQRPLTTVEKVMKKWLTGIDSDIAAKIAFSFEFSDIMLDFEKAEKKKIESVKKERKNSRQQDNQPDSTSPKTVSLKKNQYGFLIWLASWLVSFKQKKTRKKILWFLPIALQKEDIEYDDIKFALQKMGKYSDSQIDKISIGMKRAVTFLENKRVLFGIMISLIVFLTLLIILI